METVLAMLQRYAVIDDEHDLSRLTINGPLPTSLADAAIRSEKLLRDQKKLYALVQYVQSSYDRKGFIHDYFGIAR